MSDQENNQDSLTLSQQEGLRLVVSLTRLAEVRARLRALELEAQELQRQHQQLLTRYGLEHVQFKTVVIPDGDERATLLDEYNKPLMKSTSGQR